MTDTFSKEKRSEIMRQVKSSRNKSTELKLITFFKSQSINGWRRNYKLFGKPDFFFSILKQQFSLTDVFGMDTIAEIQNQRTIKIIGIRKLAITFNETNGNRILDKKGWRVIRLWECELKNGEILKEKLKLNNT